MVCLYFANIVKSQMSLPYNYKVTQTSTSSLGTGGMTTKLLAADLATHAGCKTGIVLGSEARRIFSIVNWDEGRSAGQGHNLPPCTIFSAKSNFKQGVVGKDVSDEEEGSGTS